MNALILFIVHFFFQLSQQYGVNQVICNEIMTGHAPTSLPTSTVGGPGPSGSRSFLTLQGQSGPGGHVTLNPYHYYHHEADDLHDGLAATLHLRDSVYMSPHLVRLTNTLRSKKKMMCQVINCKQTTLFTFFVKYIYTIGVKIRNMKMDFKTGGT